MEGTCGGQLRLEGAVFYSDVRDLIQTVVLPDTTTQTQNVGDGQFYGAEVGVDAPLAPQLTFGGNYTALSRTIRDALLPEPAADRRADAQGVPLCGLAAD